jgi:uncharacterized protein (TIGR02246 family)
VKRARIALIALALTSILNAQESASTRPDALAVDQLLLRWSEAISASNADALADLVTDDVEFWGDGTPAITGKAAVVSSFANTFERFSIRQTIEEKERVWDESFVLIRGIESTKISEKNILKSTEMRRRIFMMVRLEPDGKWRIARGMSNSPPIVR